VRYHFTEILKLNDFRLTYFVYLPIWKPLKIFVLLHFLDCGNEKVYKELSGEVERRLPSASVEWRR